MSVEAEFVIDVLQESEQILMQADPVTKATASIALYARWQSMSVSAQQASLSGQASAGSPGRATGQVTGQHTEQAIEQPLEKFLEQSEEQSEEQSVEQPLARLLEQSMERSQTPVRSLDAPGRPTDPKLVDPRELPRRGLGSVQGRVALVHSLAHIEFNAINLALDAVYRFRQMPLAYVTDWLRVAADEGEHFLLLHDRLHSLDSYYGVMPAHDGLWDMARRTDHDVLVRMALVPRILEARGLDVAPPMIAKLQQLGDEETAVILQRIYTDEITHVEVGNRWFRYVCDCRNLDGTEVFRDLLRGENSAYLRSPFNREARLQAGFNEQELSLIREMELEYRQANDR